MHNVNRHIVHKINASINCDLDHYQDVENVKLNEVIKDAIEELEGEFDRCSRGRRICFDTISINIQLSNTKLLTVKEKIKEELRKEILDATSDDVVRENVASSRKAKALSSLEILLYFLKTGKLPWNAQDVTLTWEEYRSVDDNDSKAENQDSFIEEKFIQPLLKALKRNPAAVSRLVHQYPESKLIELLELLVSKQFAQEVLGFKKSLQAISKKYSKIYDIGYRLGMILLEEVFLLDELLLPKIRTNNASFSISKNWKTILNGLIEKSINLYADLDLILFEEAILETNNRNLLSSLEKIRDINTSRDFSSLKSKSDDKGQQISDDGFPFDPKIENRNIDISQIESTDSKTDKTDTDIPIIDTTKDSNKDPRKESEVDASNDSNEDKQKALENIKSNELKSNKKETNTKEVDTSSRAKKPSISNAETINRLFSKSTDDTIQVFNAGIILLHPFLSSFFEKVGLIEEGQFISKECQQRAICLLHYIATGELEFHEQFLQFQKFICNYDDEDSIPKDLPISQFEKDEVDILLNAVLSHWKSLKGVTPLGLRGNYLIRNGVLQRDGNEITIHIERKTADILLNQLPWTLNFAKWTWHSKLLTIKWA